jgi:hypothetical protein
MSNRRASMTAKVGSGVARLDGGAQLVSQAAAGRVDDDTFCVRQLGSGVAATELDAVGCSSAVSQAFCGMPRAGDGVRAHLDPQHGRGIRKGRGEEPETTHAAVEVEQ